MEPRLLLQWLLDRDKDNSNSLAAKLKNVPTQPNIHKFLSGKSKQPRHSTLEPIAKHYGIPIEALYSNDVADQVMERLVLAKEKHHLSQSNHAQAATETISNVSEIQKRPRVPLISMIHAGELTDVFDIFNPGEAVVWIEPRCSSPSEQSYALKVEGDSMESPIPGAMSILEGSILVVDPNVAASANDYVIAKDIATQKANFRQLKTDGVRWYLKPLNPAYPLMEIDDPELRVIGRVMEIQPPVIKV